VFRDWVKPGKWLAAVALESRLCHPDQSAKKNPKVKHIASEPPNVVRGVRRGTLPAYTRNNLTGFKGFYLQVKARIWP